MIFPKPKLKNFSYKLWNWKFYQEHFLMKNYKVDIR